MNDRPAEYEGADILSRPTVNLCPGCKSILGHRQCHFTYSTWNCFGGCGAVLDSRVVSPILAFKCMNDFPDYQPRLGEPVHPLACSCIGRGWYPIVDPGAHSVSSAGGSGEIDDAL